MASIATVVTMGFGSFGSVNLLPTIGYGISSAVAITDFSIGWFSPARLTDWTSPSALIDWTSPPLLADWSAE